MSLSGKHQIKLKIKRPLKSFESQTTDLTKTKPIKVAKKISSNDYQNRFLSRIEEDLIDEDSENPLHFFNEIENNQFEIIPKKKSISPSLGRLSPISPEPLIKNPNPRRLKKPKNSFQGPIKIPRFPSLEERSAERDEKLRVKLSEAELLSDKKRLEKQLLKQSKSLENFEKHRKYWKKIEENMSDTLEKNPEDLRINSGKLFVNKQKELEVIEKFNKINEISEENHWKKSLRTDLKELKYFQAGSSEQRASLRLKRQFTNSLSKSPTFSADSPLAKNDYFIEKLNSYRKFTEELVISNVTQELIVKGRNKVKLELVPIKKSSEFLPSLPALEPYSEQIISRHYSPKVFY